MRAPVLDKQDTPPVPEGAVMTSVRGPQLIAVKDENGEKVADFIPVRLGLRARGFVEILSSEKPLEPGQPIVAAGVGSLILFPGAKLEPRPLRADFQPAD